MKKIFRWLTTVIVIFSIAVLHTSPANASPKQDLTPTSAETYVRDALLATGSADLLNFSKDSNDHIIRGTFILQLWNNDPEIQKITNFKIYHAVIEGDIEAAGLSIPFNVEFHNCTFTGQINLESAGVKTFRIDDSSVAGSVRMGRMIADGDLALYQSTFSGEVTLFGADIQKNLFARGSHFNGVKPDENSAYPFELWTTHVGQTTEFTDAVIKGEVKADDAKFDVNVKFDNVVFEAPASFKNIKVGNLADFHKAKFGGPVTFESSIMDRDATFTSVVFDGKADFDYLTVSRFFDFDMTTLNQDFSFQYPTVGWPYFGSATFNGPVNFEGMQASNDFDLTDVAYNYLEKAFDVQFAKVAGAVKFEGFSALAGLRLQNNEFGSLAISGQDGQRFAFINLDATSVNGDLSVENVNTVMFSAEGLNVKNSTTFKHVSVGYSLGMSNASLGSFNMDQLTWPKNSDSFNLRGATYSDIGLGAQELNDGSWSVLLNMVQESAYSPQAYRALEQFLTEKGHPEWAAKVELSRKIRERDEILYKNNTGLWLWSWFLFLFSGYGQIPALAFGWSLLVIAIGAVVFRREEDMVIIDDSEAKPVYYPVLYSFALFLPYIDLDIASKWEPKPERKAAGLYKHVHRLLGWILMPIALLTFSGIIK